MSIEGRAQPNSDESTTPDTVSSSRFVDQYTIKPLRNIADDEPPTVDRIQDPETPKTLAITDPEVIEVHIYNASTGEEISYAFPGNQVTISVLAKGPFSNIDLKVELKRNVVWGIDTVLATTYFTSVTLGSTESAWFNSSIFTLDSAISSFGRSIGKIKEYYVQFIKTTGFPDTVYYRGGEDGAGSGALTMYGEISLDRVEYYNITDNQNIPVNIVNGGWNLSARVYFRIIGGPVWDFSLYTNFKYDVRFSIDDAVVGNQVTLLIPYVTYGVLLPDQYFYTPTDTNGYSTYLYLPESRNYGNGLGETRSIYATLQMGDVTGSSLSDREYTIDRSEAEIFIRTNIVEFAPTVEFISPTSGDIVSNDTVSILADIEDINSNYLISSITLNGTEVISDYDPSNGILNTTIDLSAYQVDSLIRLEVAATDNTGMVGIGTVILQLNVQNPFIIDGYEYKQEVIQQNILDFKKSISTVLSYTPNDVDLTISIEPQLTVGVNIYSEEVLSFLIPEHVASGTSTSVYSIASAPSLNMYLNVSLDLGYSFRYDQYSFSGSQNIYFDEFLEQFYVPIGVTTFTFADVIGEKYVEPLTNIELKLSQFLPQVSWLGDISLKLDIVDMFRQIISIEGDVSTTNSQSDISRVNWINSEMKIIPMDIDLTDAPSAGLAIENLEYKYYLDFQVDFVLTLSGRVLFYDLGTINVNSWLAKNLGIIIPRIKLVLLDYTYFLGSASPINIPINPHPTEVQIIGIDRTISDQVLTISYSSDIGGIVGATGSVDFLSTSYSLVDKGDGVYQVTLPLNFENATATVSLSKTGYSSQVTEFFIKSSDQAIITSTETTTETSTETTTETATETTTEVSSATVTTSNEVTAEGTTVTETITSSASFLPFFAIVSIVLSGLLVRQRRRST